MRVLMQLKPNLHNPATLLQGLLPLWVFFYLTRKVLKSNDVRKCTIEKKTTCETVFGY